MGGGHAEIKPAATLRSDPGVRAKEAVERALRFRQKQQMTTGTYLELKELRFDEALGIALVPRAIAVVSRSIAVVSRSSIAVVSRSIASVSRSYCYRFGLALYRCDLAPYDAGPV